MDSRFHRRFGWDGAQDSLWAQSIRPLLAPREMNASAAHVAQTVRRLFLKPYQAAFGHGPGVDDEEVLVDVGKALAAYQETLVSARTHFDDFRDALQKGPGERGYPLAAQRGLRIFIGKGNCSVCHSGPRFTNGEGGIEKLKRSPFTLLGRYNDDKSGASAVATRDVEVRRRNFGQFRVPGLRGVAQTAPYMHNGSLATLADVVKFHGEMTLKPLRLTARESADLVAFLESLSAPGVSRMDQRAP